MTATALVSGKLQRDPERKMSKAGKPFLSATLREGEGEGTTWWSILVFAEPAIAELEKLRAGDSVAASGGFKAEIYEKGEARRISFTMFADRIISARKLKRDRTRHDARPQNQQQDRFFDGDVE